MSTLSVKKEFAGFANKEAFRVATPEEKTACKWTLRCKMVFCKKPISESQRQERKLKRSVIEKSRTYICGNFQDNLMTPLCLGGVWGKKLFLRHQV
eukprot:880353-Amphidinium_carterae.1